MNFYEEISEYYDYIFPIGNEPIDFITGTCGKPPCSILDVACGTGGYSLELSKLGYNLTASDIDAKMVELTKTKAKQYGLKIEVILSDMLALSGKLHQKYEILFCIGNSLVHLDNIEELKQFLINAKNSLTPHGKAIFQIINYDRVLEKSVSSLPTIRNNEIGLTFERNYKQDSHTKKILFNTILTVNEKRIENTISLFPLMSSDFEKLLNEAGFNNTEFFGDFNGGKYLNSESYMLVVKAF